MQTVDQRIYQMLLQQDIKQDQNPQNPLSYGSSFFVHAIFKAVPILLILFQGIIVALLSKLILLEIIIVVVVLDFWLTKNVIGKKMIGVRWGFQQNQYGDQKFQFQGRVNEQHVSPLSTKLFWLVLIVYVLAAAVLTVFGFLSGSASIFKHVDDFLIRVGIFLAGAINFYFFWRARQGLSTRRGEMLSKLGNEFVGKLGLATIVSYL